MTRSAFPIPKHSLALGDAAQGILASSLGHLNDITDHEVGHDIRHISTLCWKGDLILQRFSGSYDALPVLLWTHSTDNAHRL